jgi:hypothetical protein
MSYSLDGTTRKKERWQLGKPGGIVSLGVIKGINPKTRGEASRVAEAPASSLLGFSLTHFSIARGYTLWVGSTTMAARLTGYYLVRGFCYTYTPGGYAGAEIVR